MFYRRDLGCPALRHADAVIGADDRVRKCRLKDCRFCCNGNMTIPEEIFYGG